MIQIRGKDFNESREWVEYWLTRSPEERIMALEDLRRQFWGDDAINARIPRTAESVQILRR